MEPITNEVAKVHLITCFADALRESITTIRNVQCFCAASTMSGEDAPLEEDQSSLLMSVRLRGTLHGELGIKIASNDVCLLFPEAELNDIDELWHGLMEGVVQQLPKRAVDAGIFAFSIESHGMTELPGDAVQIGRMELVETDKSAVILRIVADDELVRSLQIAEWSASHTQARAKSKENVRPELGRVIDVPLNVTLRFGQRTMRLRDVLELNTGTLIELDRQVEEPVDLVLDERVIARGEVVIVDGNYGLRVTEIVEHHPTLVV